MAYSSRMQSACALAALAARLAPSAAAQTGSFVAGSFLGVAYAVGDVDDDGHGDYFVRFTHGWEVRSGASGQSFPYLTRRANNCISCIDTGLSGDLDAYGHGDLEFTDGSGLIQFVSGANSADTARTSAHAVALYVHSALTRYGSDSTKCRTDTSETTASHSHAAVSTSARPRQLLAPIGRHELPHQHC